MTHRRGNRRTSINLQALNTLNAAYTVADTLRCLMIESASFESDTRALAEMVNDAKTSVSTLYISDAYVLLDGQYNIGFSTHVETTSAPPATLEQAHTLCLMIDAIRAMYVAPMVEGAIFARERALRHVRELMCGRGYVALNVVTPHVQWRLYVQIARVQGRVDDAHP